MRRRLACFSMVLLLLIAGAVAEDRSGLTIMTNVDTRKHIVQYTYTDQDNQIVTGSNGYAISECQYDGNRE